MANPINGRRENSFHSDTDLHSIVLGNIDFAIDRDRAPKKLIASTLNSGRNSDNKSTQSSSTNDQSSTSSSPTSSLSTQQCESEQMVIIPSAPTIGHHLYNDEKDADIVFLVGLEKNNLWRFPAHSLILKNTSSYFRKIIIGKNNNNNREIIIDWCDPLTFEIILKYAYTEEVTFKSVPATLNLLNIANKFSMISLSKHCLTFLQKQCNQENALGQLKFFKNYFDALQYEKTNPIESELFDYITNLEEHIFYVIDQNGSKIITSDEFLILNKAWVRKILVRDTLQCASELEVYESICRWASQQCKQQRKELTDANRRFILQDLIFCPRYLTMKIDEFKNGPFKDEILEEEDKQSLLKALTNQANNCEIPEKFRHTKLDKPRCSKSDVNESKTNSYNGTIDSNGTRNRPTQKSKPNANQLIRSISLDKGLNEKKKRSVPRRIIKGLGSVMIMILKVLD
ncbi:BTB/POZ domain-containing protein 6 [Sarcoptes scabiei]|uniref:BTB/POZ domain-containing protein 6 n=1 Tax=Sarcoptes scabiei TaxID=52283 RepID=A0A132ACF2_SARSC|nr:BTB/POZ domain-containing protein 6 [Sarcoptes scabiei]